MLIESETTGSVVSEENEPRLRDAGVFLVDCFVYVDFFTNQEATHTVLTRLTPLDTLGDAFGHRGSVVFVLTLTALERDAQIVDALVG